MSNGAHGDWFVTCFFTNETALLKRPASARRTVSLLWLKFKKAIDPSESDGSNSQLKL